MTTDNHELNTPDEGTLNWDEPLNENFRIIDQRVEIRDVEQNLDSYEPKDGAKFYAIDTGRRFLADGSEWYEASPQPLSELNVPNVSSDPDDAVPGQIWYRDDTYELKVQLDSGVQSLVSGTDNTDDGDSDTTDNTSDGDDSETTHELKITAADGASWDTYEAVIEGEITDTFDLNSGDTITVQDDGTVILDGGVKDGRSEGVYFTGTLLSLTLDLDGTAYLDGEAIDPSNY